VEPDRPPRDRQTEPRAAVRAAVRATVRATGARATGARATTTATTTATASAGTAGSFFDTGDAQAFQERWRDVQLRFVDSPKEATAEAAGLVDEAVDRLAASLREQKGKLAGGGAEDTEKLRVELRAYRDLLNRILGL